MALRATRIEVYDMLSEPLCKQRVQMQRVLKEHWS
jgi:hypothetical protein